MNGKELRSIPLEELENNEKEENPRMTVYRVSDIQWPENDDPIYSYLDKAEEYALNLSKIKDDCMIVVWALPIDNLEGYNVSHPATICFRGWAYYP